MLLERISTGGMSEVYRANATGPNGFARAVAIKCILPHLSSDTSFTEMFIDEAKISARLHHPHICQIYDFGRVDDSYFLAMEHVEGQPLRMVQQRFHGRRIRVPQALGLCIVSELCDALDYAHGLTDREGRPLDIVHRDIKPQNVLISYQGEVKLIDFGIAKASHRLAATRESFKGTFAYMAPEQVSARAEVDHRADIFAAGLILHELLTGKRVYGKGDDASMVDMVREARIAPPSTMRRSITEDLDAIAMRALARDPDKRYQRAGDLKADIEEYRLAWGQLCSRSDIAAMMEELFEHEIEQHRQREARLAAVRHPIEETITVPGQQPASVPEDDTPSWQSDCRRSYQGLTPPLTGQGAQTWRSWGVFGAGLLCLLLGVAAAAYAVGVTRGDRSGQHATSAPSRLQIATHPPGASVEIRSGKQVLLQARAPLEVGGLVTGRSYLVRAKLEGHIPVEREIVWGPGSNARVNLSLSRLGK
jgi:serine/threonine protein kinase